eukprot:12685008-Prorocentrum_lima.AAC.1
MGFPRSPLSTKWPSAPGVATSINLKPAPKTVLEVVHTTNTSHLHVQSSFLLLSGARPTSSAAAGFLAARASLPSLCPALLE